MPRDIDRVGIWMCLEDHKTLKLAAVKLGESMPQTLHLLLERDAEAWEAWHWAAKEVAQ